MTYTIAHPGYWLKKAYPKSRTYDYQEGFSTGAVWGGIATAITAADAINSRMSVTCGNANDGATATVACGAGTTDTLDIVLGFGNHNIQVQLFDPISMIALGPGSTFAGGALPSSCRMIFTGPASGNVLVRVTSIGFFPAYPDIFYIYDVNVYHAASTPTVVCSDEDYRFGFNGQEKDNEAKGQGNSYDFGARIYDSRLGKFLSIDPLAREYSDWSYYSFAADNPIRLIDIDGLKPGDPFDSEEDALLDFANIYNKKSIRNTREYATVIYKYIDEEGNVKYSYNRPKKGGQASSVARPLRGKGKTIVAHAHTHGYYYQQSDNEFSPDDFSQYAYFQINNAYVVTPSGKIIRFMGFNRETAEPILKTLDKEGPSDPKDPTHNDNPVKLRAIDGYRREKERKKADSDGGLTAAERAENGSKKEDESPVDKENKDD